LAFKLFTNGSTRSVSTGSRAWRRSARSHTQAEGPAHDRRTFQPGGAIAVVSTIQRNSQLHRTYTDVRTEGRNTRDGFGSNGDDSSSISGYGEGIEGGP
jgi:hypothetical protein